MPTGPGWSATTSTPRPEPSTAPSVARGRVRLFLSEHRGDARPDTLVYLRLDAVETIADEFGATVEEAPRGVREIELRDPDGNRLRIGTPTG
ncbi:MAG TPA: hypothetical protein VL330_24350 [Actinomycetes bacterium]|nr:hypothetical protein [Actinomycetes bacterium]